MYHCYYYVMIFTLVRLSARRAYNTRVPIYTAVVRAREIGLVASTSAVLSSPPHPGYGVVSFTPARQHRDGDVCNKRLMRIYTLFAERQVRLDDKRACRRRPVIIYIYIYIYTAI